MSSSLQIPDWFNVQSAPKPPTIAVADAVLKFLKDCDNESIVEECRKLLLLLDIAACDLISAYILFKILKAKNVKFPELKDDAKELQVHQRIAKFLFPTEYKRMLPVNSSQANATSNSYVHIEENTRSPPRTPRSIDKLAIQDEAKPNSQKVFQNEIIAPFNSKNNSKNKFRLHSPVQNSAFQNQMPSVYENESRERGQQPFHLRPSVDRQCRNRTKDLM